MSPENLEIVLGLQPAPGVDIARLFRDGADLTSLVGLLHPDFEAAFVDALRGTTTYPGVDGLTRAWLDWVSPWATYRSETEDAVEVGDRVLLLVRDYARRQGSTHEVVLLGAAVWTLRSGKVIRAEFHADRATALDAVGLER